MQYLNIDSMMMVFHEGNKRHLQDKLKEAARFNTKLDPTWLDGCKQWSLEQVKLLKLHFKYYPIRHHAVGKPRRVWYAREEYNPLKEKKV